MQRAAASFCVKLAKDPEYLPDLSSDGFNYRDFVQNHCPLPPRFFVVLADPEAKTSFSDQSTLYQTVFDHAP